MRLRDEWSQDVILRAMSNSIAQARGNGRTLDFVLVTGDLAFSGKSNEYELVKGFLTAISEASGVPRDRFFCVPGNHDVDRDKQRLCFIGARQHLLSPNAVDPVLAPDDNLGTLIQRQRAYRDFQASYFAGQARTATADGLAYVTSLAIDDVVVAIVGLNSAWLSEGGAGDHGKLLIGERQLMAALDIADCCKPHVVIAMAHHPLHLLHEFDRVAALNHITASCDFFHCGHLHQPEARGAGFDAQACLTVAAGASFETRESHNTYSVVRLDLNEGTRTLTTVQYDKSRGGFLYSNDELFPFELSPAATCELGELADAIGAFSVDVVPFAHYLAALLLGQKAEVPLAGPGGHVFASVAVLQAQPDDDLCRKTIEFLRFRNALRVFVGRVPLHTLLQRRGQAVKIYGDELKARCAADSGLAARVSGHDGDVRRLLASQPKVTYAVDLLADLAAAQEWDLLRQQAERQLDSPNPAVVVQARRMMALALAHGSEDADKQEAIRQYRALIADGAEEVADRVRQVALLHGVGDFDEAKRLVLESLGLSPPSALADLLNLGHQLVADTGDRSFRLDLEAALAQRENHD
jgi:predicted phosphodiesterase